MYLLDITHTQEVSPDDDDNDGNGRSVRCVFVVVVVNDGGVRSKDNIHKSSISGFICAENRERMK